MTDAAAVSLGGVAIYTRDARALASFYNELLGIDTLHPNGYSEAQTPGGVLGVVDTDAGPVGAGPVGGSGVDVTVEAVDIDREFERLSGLEWDTPPTWELWGRFGRLIDPDGNTVTVQERSPATADWRIRDWAGARTAEHLLWHLREAWWWMRRVLDGLTDEEYFWEPVDDCWSVRRTDAGWAADLSSPEPDPAPFTTIAWRLAHVQADLDGFARMVFPSADPPAEVAGSAADAKAAIAAAVGRIRDGLASADDDAMRADLNAHWRTYPAWATLCHALVEATHHTAEVGVVRDLYRRLGAPR